MTRRMLQLESRMRENRMYGSEGGAANTVPTPIKSFQNIFNTSKKQIPSGDKTKTGPLSQVSLPLS